MSRKIPKAVWEGDIDIMGIKLKCFVLDDGRRIIDANSMAEFIAAMADPSQQMAPDDIIEMVKFLRSDDIPTFEMKQ